MIIKIGTRKSKLALTQTNLVINHIRYHFPEIICKIIPITTTGDVITDKALYDIGGKALFLKEIEQQLFEDKINIAVHSLKDVPGEMPKGLKIAGVLEREDASDTFVSFEHKSIFELPEGAVIGSSSVRRKIFLQRIRPDLQVVIFRGNVDTRIKKLQNGEVDATILATAGLKRINAFDEEYCHIIPTDQMIPAVGQGVISLEIRENDPFMQNVCDAINHKPTWDLMQVEREFLKQLKADCRTPLSAYSFWEGNNIKTNFMLSNIDGSNVNFHTQICSPHENIKCGEEAAKILLEKCRIAE